MLKSGRIPQLGVSSSTLPSPLTHHLCHPLTLEAKTAIFWPSCPLWTLPLSDLVMFLSLAHVSPHLKWFINILIHTLHFYAFTNIINFIFVSIKALIIFFPIFSIFVQPLFPENTFWFLLPVLSAWQGENKQRNSSNRKNPVFRGENTSSRRQVLHHVGDCIDSLLRYPAGVCDTCHKVNKRNYFSHIWEMHTFKHSYMSILVAIHGDIIWPTVPLVEFVYLI